MIKLVETRTFQTDKELLDYVMDNRANDIPPEVYDTISKGHTVYNEDKAFLDKTSEETGQDPWDGESLVRWIGDGNDDVDIHTVS